MNLYLLFKSLHLIAVISWTAGLLYLPRIFVYHSEAEDESQKKVFKIMERKLYNYIMMPAMLLSWLFGILLIHSLGFSVFSETCFLADAYATSFMVMGFEKSKKLSSSIDEIEVVLIYYDNNI